MKRILKDTRIQYIIFGLILCCIPLLQEVNMVKTSTVIVLGSVIIYAIATIGLDVLLGYSGLISLGTAGFMGLAAYVSAYVTGVMELPFELVVLAAFVVTMLIGAVVGLISLRIQGIYLAIATLCVSEILLKTFKELLWFSNSFSGRKTGHPTLLGLIELDMNGTFIFMSIVLVLVMILTHNFKNSRSGRAMNAIRESETAAQAMGVNLLKMRMTAFLIATFCAVLSGVFYAHFVNFVYPSTWTLSLSLNIMAAVIIGGTRSVSGAILGTFVVFGMPELLLKKVPVVGEMSGFTLIFTGVLIIVIILLYPNGLIKLPSDVWKKIKALRGRKGGEEIHE